MPPLLAGKKAVKFAKSWSPFARSCWNLIGWCCARCERNEKVRICQVGWYEMAGYDGIASLRREVDACVLIK